MKPKLRRLYQTEQINVELVSFYKRHLGLPIAGSGPHGIPVTDYYLGRTVLKIVSLNVPSTMDSEAYYTECLFRNYYMSEPTFIPE